MQNLYSEIILPSFAPPGWLFGPVWSFLYLLIFISFGAVILGIVRKKFPLSAIIAIVINLVSNLLWTFLFFQLKNFDLALLDIFIVWGSIIYIIWYFWHKKRWISYIQVPYLLWVSFASILMVAIWFLN